MLPVCPVCVPAVLPAPPLSLLPEVPLPVLPPSLLPAVPLPVLPPSLLPAGALPSLPDVPADDMPSPLSLLPAAVFSLLPEVPLPALPLSLPLTVLCVLLSAVPAAPALPVPAASEVPTAGSSFESLRKFPLILPVKALREGSGTSFFCTS